MSAADCIFCKIATGIIKVEPVYEDLEFVAFRDQNPQAPVHLLLIPKTHFETVLDMHDEGLMGRALKAVQSTAIKAGIDNGGFRTVINTRDDSGQTVYHVHFHILGGRFMQWPPG